MAHLVFRCDRIGRVVLTGIEIDPGIYADLATGRRVKCRFCGQDHPRELVERVPGAAAQMSLKAEEFLARGIQSEAYAAKAADPDVRHMFEEIATQWHRLAVDREAKADVLS